MALACCYDSRCRRSERQIPPQVENATRDLACPPWPRDHPQGYCGRTLLPSNATGRRPLSKAPARPDVARMDFRFAGPGPEIDTYESSRCIREIEVRASAGFHCRFYGPGRNDPGTEIMKLDDSRNRSISRSLLTGHSPDFLLKSLKCPKTSQRSGSSAS